MTQYDLGQVVGANGQDGADGSDGSTIWYTSTAPTYANSKYTFTISNLTGKTGFTIAVSDLIFYDTYYYIVSTVNSTTVDCATRVSIKGADGSSATVTIVDNLTSDSSTSVLSAKQGKVLNTNKLETSAIATSFSSTTSDSKVPSEKLVKTELDKKIATSSTNGLVKNDGSIDTSSYITSSALSGYQTTANLVTSFSGTTSDSKYPSEKLTKTELDKKITKSNSATGLLKDDGTVMTSGTGSSNWAVGNHTHSAYVNPTKVTSWSSTPSDSNVASEKLIKDSLDGKQATLVSGTSIKTINNESLLGSGNISVGGGSSVDIVTSWEPTPSDSKVASEKLTKDSLDNKISKSSTTGLVKNDGSIDTNTYLTSSAITGMLTSSDIANNLTTSTTGKVLDASQGKALADLIGDAITYINQ